MLKNFLITFLIFNLIAPESSWANSSNFSNQEIYKISDKSEQNFFLTEQPYQLVNINNNSQADNSFLWITSSIFLPGLGQIMMGDTGKGLRFMLIHVLGLAINTYILSTNRVLSTPIGFPSGQGIIVFFTTIILLVNYLINFLDALSMSENIINQSNNLSNEKDLINKIKFDRQNIYFEAYKF